LPAYVICARALNGGLDCNPSDATRKDRWIGQLGRLNLRPIMRVLEQPPLGALEARERYWQHWIGSTGTHAGSA